MLSFVTPEDIFCGVVDWLDHVLIGYILVASTTRCFSTTGVEELYMVNVTHEAIFPLMNCHVEAQQEIPFSCERDDDAFSVEHTGCPQKPEQPAIF